MGSEPLIPDSEKDEQGALAITVEFTSSSLPDTSPFTTNTGFRGGLEMLFSNERKLKISLPVKDPNGTPSDIAYLVQYLCQNIMRDQRKELFVLNNTV
jgi:ubiquitin related modifier 1